MVGSQHTSVDPSVETNEKLIRVAEIFGPTIQGEGALIGRPTIFVRTGGCDFRCSWCDSLHAVMPVHRGEWVQMTPRTIIERVDELSDRTPTIITVSGGNPALQPLGEFIEQAHASGYEVALETQGTVAPNWLSALDYLCISPKPPSSGMPMNQAKLDQCIAKAAGCKRISIKVVVFDDADFEFAHELWSETREDIPFYLSVGNNNVAPNADPYRLATSLLVDLRWLVQKVQTARMNDVAVLPQLHVLMWGNKRAV